MIKLEKLILDIIQKLGLDDNIKSNFYIPDIEVENKELIEKIYELLKHDESINNFQVKNDETRNNIDILKNNLAILQIKTILKLFKNNKISHDDGLKEFIKLLNNRIDVMNTILEQKGGSFKNYSIKYIKYKSKYLKLKNNLI